jgi:hypothetical protein
MGDMAAGRVFISHCVRDHDGVHDLVRYLETRDIFVWIAPRDVRPGLDYSEQIQEAIEQCSAFIVIVTEAANASLFVRAETEMAFSSRRPIFPVRFGEMEPAKGLRLFLNIHHWTNAFGPESPSNLQRLATELATLSGIPDGSAPPPAEAALARPATAAPPSQPALAAADPPAETAAERTPLLTRPRVAMAVAAALLLSLSLAWPLVADRGDAAAAVESPASPGPAADPRGIGKVVAEPAGGQKPAATADPPPAARSAAVQTLGDARTTTPRRASANPVAAAPIRRMARRPARAAPPRRAPVRTQMPCRRFTVAESGREDRDRACAGTRGMVILG